MISLGVCGRRRKTVRAALRCTLSLLEGEEGGGPLIPPARLFRVLRNPSMGVPSKGFQIHRTARVGVIEYPPPPLGQSSTKAGETK